MKNFSTAFGPADILLPNISPENMQKWAVVACDQFTSQPEYWKDAAEIAENSPSALDLILPEAYLEAPDAEERIDNIHQNMKRFLDDNLFTEYKNSFIYLERTDSVGNIRCGLVGMIDLEQYDFSKGSTSPVRATEATVAERIPPRLKVRQGAPLELPHIMILIDDGDKTVIEPLAAEKDGFRKLYDFELMKNGGRAAGWLVSEKAAEQIDKTLSALHSKIVV